MRRNALSTEIIEWFGVRSSGMKLYTYLNYGGNCAQAFRFYEAHLGAKIIMMMTHGQMPNAQAVPPDRKDTILHARMSIGETELMGADVPPERFQPMRSAYLSLLVDGTEEAEYLCLAVRWRRDLHEDGGNVFRLPLCNAPGQVWHVVDDPSRTSKALVLLTVGAIP